MSRRDEDELELQILLRNVAAIVLLALISLIVIFALITPLLTDRNPDTTLLLGLVASFIGALPVLLGVQFAINRKKPNGDA
jgi:hypothetical protein